jgi:hypothetical protein
MINALLAGLWTILVAMLGMWAGGRYNPLEVMGWEKRIRLVGVRGMNEVLGQEFKLKEGVVKSFDREEFVREFDRCAGIVDKTATVCVRRDPKTGRFVKGEK